MEKAKKKVVTKGIRLNWTPLKDIKPITLTAADLTGERVVFTGLDHAGKPHNYLIP